MSGGVVTGPGGVFDNQGVTLTGVQFTDAQHTGSGSVINNGTINTAPTPETSYYIRSAAVTNNGLIQIPAGANVDFGGQNGVPNTSYTAVNSPTGVISVDDGQLTIAGHWSNAGVINATDKSIVVLGGTTTTAGLGTINASVDSHVDLYATVDNTGNTLTLSNAASPWTLPNTGEILNGTVATGSNLYIVGGLLDGVTVAPGTSIDVNTYFAGNWSNEGTINGIGYTGPLTLGGSFTTAAMGNITGSPTVDIVGSLDNSNSTLIAGSAAKPWYLEAVGADLSAPASAGTITGGIIGAGSSIVCNAGTLSGVTISSGATVSVPIGPQTGPQATLALTGPWTNEGAISVVASSTLYVSGTSGPAGPSATVANNGNMTQASGIVYPGALSGTGTLVIGNTAGGSSASMTVASLTQSSVTINATGSLAITGGSGNGVNTLVINAGGQLDLTGTSLAVNYTPGNDPAATIRGYLTTGYNGDTWTGPGIVSSTAAGNTGLYAVGYADGNVDQGTAAAANQVLVEFTLAGDANLDGTVNFADLLVVAQNFNHALDTHGNAIDWADGDFNYDGVVNFADLLLIAQNFNKQLTAGQLDQLPGSFAADWQLAEAEVAASQTNNVPEPEAVSLLILAAAALLARKRNRGPSVRA